MGSRSERPQRKNEVYEANNNIDVLIDRLKKIRALNGDPSLFGMDSYVLKRLHFNKLSILTKS